MDKIDLRNNYIYNAEIYKYVSAFNRERFLLKQKTLIKNYIIDPEVRKLNN